MKLETLMQGVPYTVLQTGDFDEADFITHDSQKTRPGCLFICIRGFRKDGHKYIDDAAVAGAAAVVIDKEQEYYPPGLTVLKVNSSRSAMSYIAANYYGNPAKDLKLIGVTGTNGKTSATYFIETLLEATKHKVGVIGTMGTRIGREVLDIPFDTVTTPDPLELHYIFAQMRDLGATHVVMEVSSHALALNKTAGFWFDVGVFTNITQDHLDFHITMDNYKAAKAKLFKQSRFGVLNADDVSMPVIRGNLSDYFTYGIENDCDLKAIHTEYTAEGSSFEIVINEKPEYFHLHVKGKFNVYNCLAAIGALLALGVPVADIQMGVEFIKGVPGRIQSVPNKLGANILIDYAHSPDGLVSVINAVREFTEGRVITLFGCGGDKDKLKRPVMGRIAGELSDACIVTTDNPRSEDPLKIINQIIDGLKETNTPYETYVDRREAIQAGIGMLTAGDALIIAGKGHETVQHIGDKLIPFDDYEVALDILEQ
jgi:UDP-N-acetylmuramoyl-L-alanyl-D-glutamate--2,6-diaminopimelate ligase